MNAYRFRTLAPNAASAAGIAADEPPRRAVEAAYRAGFLAGQAAATEAHLDEQHRLTSGLVEAIADSRVTNEAARCHVLASVSPMVEALVLALVPALANVGLAGDLAQLVERALAGAPEARPRIRCAPEVVDGAARCLEARGLAASVEEGPELLPGEAQVLWDQGYDHLDLDACAAEIRACIASHLRRNQGEDDDPRRYG
jgi:hypothetical protein